ncbi:hypothetical protein GRF29_1g3370250 [Pseudopithomyces chartarum]|uniref:alpha-galactosidase n=1 Tax=Pseudopithomyces chartarum TaxID=1892770 RepID=A0AAN6RNE7_9PLEO|nr:hypothetical protein GRF29_1g3370250 [Pseudopithomyces chartarum]
MRSAVAVALSGAIGLAAARPQLERRAVDKYPAGTTWDIVLDKSSVNLNNLASTEAAKVAVIDIDMFDNDAATISKLKKDGKKVICYFSAGSRENWRGDASRFTSNDYGKVMDGWEEENWVNVKSQNVKNIMADRIKLAASKGCDAVDPDNTDGFVSTPSTIRFQPLDQSGSPPQNPPDENEPPQDGYNWGEQAYVDYFKFLAGEAKKNNMAIGLKNSISMIPQVVNLIQFAVNEQCHEYNECEDYLPLTQADKAVFAINYGPKDCTSPGGTKLSILTKPSHQNLNVTGGACKPSWKTASASLTSVDEEPAVEEATPAPETGDEEEEEEEYDDEENEDENEDEEEGPWWSHRHD